MLFCRKASENLREITLGDHLLYWRLYGNDCRGASISLPTHLVEKLLKQSIIDRVIYSDEQPDYEPKISSLLKLLQDIDELRSEAIKEGTWPKICGNILPDTDRFFKQRFLHKRSDFNMEREYRAITFISNDNAEDYVNMKRGQHVQFGLIRNYLQIVDLNCQSIFTSGTKITVGNNVRNSREAKEYIAETLRKQGTDYLGVSVSVSQIEYRPH